MTVTVQLTCPLGAKCEEIKDNVMHRCMWYIKLRGTNPNTGAEVDEHGCAMAWLPVLLVENAGATRSASAAIESLRNEVSHPPVFQLIGNKQ
jgi:hypothetical protein